MKKLVLFAALLLTNAVAYAGSFTAEYTDAQGVKGGADQVQMMISIKENINKNISVDGKIQNTQTTGSSALSTRVELGTAYTTPLFGVNPYVRLAIGNKYKNTGDFTYYSVEPGVVFPTGIDKLTGRMAWQFRTAFDSVATADTTHMWRAGVSYAVTKQDSVGVRYDNMRGDASSNSWNLVYTRNF